MTAITTETGVEMNLHATIRSWRYTVPPNNLINVVITQRTDGPFRSGADTPGAQCFYVGAERWDGRQWHLMDGTSSGDHSSWEIAFAEAVKLWKKVQR